MTNSQGGKWAYFIQIFKLNYFIISRSLFHGSVGTKSLIVRIFMFPVSVSAELQNSAVAPGPRNRQTVSDA